MSRISKDDVRHVAALARLQVTETEVESFTTQLEDILEHASAISVIDTEGVEPTSHPIAQVNVFRPDEPHKSLSQEEVLLNAPAKEESRFKVPQILGSEE